MLFADTGVLTAEDYSVAVILLNSKVVCGGCRNCAALVTGLLCSVRANRLLSWVADETLGICKGIFNGGRIVFG